MAKYILALIEVESNTAPESVVMSLSHPGAGVTKSRYTILNSDSESNAGAFKMIDDIMGMPIFAQNKTALRNELDIFKGDVGYVLDDEKPASNFPEDDLLEIYNEFQDRLARDVSYQDIYWDTLRDVLFKRGYEPEWGD